MTRMLARPLSHLTRHLLAAASVLVPVVVSGCDPADEDGDMEQRILGTDTPVEISAMMKNQLVWGPHYTGLTRYHTWFAASNIKRNGSGVHGDDHPLRYPVKLSPDQPTFTNYAPREFERTDIMSAFGPRISGDSGDFHPGIDITYRDPYKGDSGDTDNQKAAHGADIIAVADGTVVKVPDPCIYADCSDPPNVNDKNNTCIVIKHEFQNSPNWHAGILYGKSPEQIEDLSNVNVFYTWYCHLSAWDDSLWDPILDEGKPVEAGTPIGKLGRRKAKHTHLHFEVRVTHKNSAAASKAAGHCDWEASAAKPACVDPRINPNALFFNIPSDSQSPDTAQINAMYADPRAAWTASVSKTISTSEVTLEMTTREALVHPNRIEVLLFRGQQVRIETFDFNERAGFSLKAIDNFTIERPDPFTGLGTHLWEFTPHPLGSGNAKWGLDLSVPFTDPVSVSLYDSFGQFVAVAGTVVDACELYPTQTGCLALPVGLNNVGAPVGSGCFEHEAYLWQGSCQVVWTDWFSYRRITGIADSVGSYLETQ